MRGFVVLLVVMAACSTESVPPVRSTDAPPAPVATPNLVTTTTKPPVPTTALPAETLFLTPPTSAIPTPGSSAPSAGNWFVVWVTGWIPQGFAADLRDVPGVDVVSVVGVGNAHVVETRNAAGQIIDETKPGFVIPVELHAIDPADHQRFVPSDVYFLLADLAPDQVILGRSSARFHRLGPGGTLTLEDGTTLTVAGVVDDEWVGAAELVTTSPDAITLGADRERYAVVRFEGDREALEPATVVLTDKSVRVWGEGEVDMFRHADAVQSQIRIKERFGEFSYRPLGGQSVEIDPEWVAANIVMVRLPLIGSITCHRDFAALLRQVMDELESGGNGRIINSGSDNGCWNARFIAGRRDLSRHAWGIAADINWGNPHDSLRSPVAPALLAATSAAGITSGHEWVNPDPGHFEWYGPPD